MGLFGGRKTVFVDADILVSMAGHVATKLFLGEYWTGATGDFQRRRPTGAAA